MLINQVTLSDGEMTASGFKALKLGTLMGTATYRWLIFTYHATLLNGGFFRIPEWGCYTPGMKDLETHGVKPDIVVHNHLADRLAGRDPQLKQAVQLLLKKLTSKKKK
jgi:tricorn protease